MRVSRTVLRGALGATPEVYSPASGSVPAKASTAPEPARNLRVTTLHRSPLLWPAEDGLYSRKRPIELYRTMAESQESCWASLQTVHNFSASATGKNEFDRARSAQ